jgi:uncharacterized protein YfbU (UPF0304 family)
MNFTPAERLIVLMLAEIHEKIGVKDGIEPAFIKRAIYTGNAWAIPHRYTGVFDVDDHDQEVVDEVGAIMDMWMRLEDEFGRLSKAEKNRVLRQADPFKPHFKGFDGNNEGSHLSVARFYIEQMELYRPLAGRDLNSHWPLLAAYRRMLPVFEAEFGDGGLDADGIVRVLKAQAAD